MTKTRTLTLAGLAASGLALTTMVLPATSLPAASSTQAGEAGVLTYTLAAKDSESTFVDERRRGESVGDRYYSAATLRSGGEVAGRLQGECAVLDKTFEGHLCHLVLVVEGGQLTFTGGGTHKPIPNVGEAGDVFALTGGTGEFQGARGQMVAEEDGRTLTITLTHD